MPSVSSSIKRLAAKPIISRRNVASEPCEQALAPRRTAAQPGHVRLDPVDRLRRSTIDKDQASWLQARLLLAPFRACCGDVGAIPLGRAERPFFA